MATTANIRIQGAISGLADGGSVAIGPITLAPGTPVPTRLDPLNLSSGTNTITVPSGATVMVFIPPTSNTNTLTLKGVGGDTGVALSKTAATILTLDTGVANVVIGAGGTVSGCVIQFI